MDKLLTEEEYNALLADRERLEWLMRSNGAVVHVGMVVIPGFGTGHKTFKAPTTREAIDKARGSK